jgi:peroxiredoxin Q/BCP
MPATACAVLTASAVRARHAACARRTCVATAAHPDGQAPMSVAPASAVLSGRRGVALSLAVLAATVQVSQRPALAAAAPAPGVGDSAPAFELPSTKGGALSLTSLLSSGKYLVLYFYNADGTTGCSLEAQRFQQALPSLEAAGAQLVGVSMDDLSKHTEFCSDKKLTFPLLSDKTGDVSASYGADLKIPILGRFSDRQTFLIEPSGKIVGKWKEQDGSMASVKTMDHANQVLEKIKGFKG